MYLLRAAFIICSVLALLARGETDDVHVLNTMMAIGEMVRAPVVYAIHGITDLELLFATELEKLNATKDIYYVCDQGVHRNLPIKVQGAAIVCCFGDGEVHSSGRSTMHMRGSSAVVAREFSMANLMERSSGVLYDRAKGHVQDYANCAAHMQSIATVWGSANCRAYDDATLYLYGQSAGACHDTSECHAFDRAVMVCHGQATVHVYDKAHCYAHDGCKVYLYSETASVLSRGPRVQLVYAADAARMEEIVASVKSLPIVSRMFGLFYALFIIFLMSMLFYRLVRCFLARH